MYGSGAYVGFKETSFASTGKIRFLFFIWGLKTSFICSAEYCDCISLDAFSYILEKSSVLIAYAKSAVVSLTRAFRSSSPGISPVAESESADVLVELAALLL